MSTSGEDIADRFALVVASSESWCLAVAMSALRIRRGGMSRAQRVRERSYLSASATLHFYAHEHAVFIVIGVVDISVRYAGQSRLSPRFSSTFLRCKGRFLCVLVTAVCVILDVYACDNN